MVAQMVRCLPAMREIQVQSLGREDPLEKGMATHSSILAWKILWTEEPGGYIPWGRKESDMTERLHFNQINGPLSATSCQLSENRRYCLLFHLSRPSILPYFTFTDQVPGVPMDDDLSFLIPREDCYCYCSVTQSCLTLCDPMDWSTLQGFSAFTVSLSLLKLMSTESMRPSNHPLPPPSLPSLSLFQY